MAIKAANVTIMVRDMDRSVSFYRSLGMTEQDRWGDHYAQLSAPGIVLGLHPIGTNTAAGNSGNVSIGFTADDFDAARQLLGSLSISLTERNEDGGQFLHFRDPDGTALYFIKPKW